ncbi:hypothetical protein HETIRDRAFT_311912, partial [Heterobasidion irregulare TC 32-1]
CLVQSQNRLGAIISHSLLLLSILALPPPALEVILVLCSALRATSSITMSLGIFSNAPSTDIHVFVSSY